jgi:hypothetical protein
MFTVSVSPLVKPVVGMVTLTLNFLLCDGAMVIALIIVAFDLSLIS